MNLKRKIKNKITDISKQIHTRKIIRIYEKKIKKISSNLSDLYNTGFDKKRIGRFVFRDYWSPVYKSVNKVDSQQYIPESVYYSMIEPRFNRFDLLNAYKDKNSINKILTKVKTPSSVVKNINGIYLDSNDTVITIEKAARTIMEYKELIIKPSIDSGGGKSVQIISPKKSTFEELIFILRSYQKDFTVQRLIVQSESLNKIYPNSLNTIRVMTMRLDGEIIHLSSVARFGNNESRIDNQAQGGVACGIDQFGRLKDFAVNKNGNRFVKHPQTKEKFNSYKIENFNKIIQEIKIQHESVYYFDIISWDIAITNDDFKVIEINLRNQEINFHQFCNGPLFGDYTEQVLSKL